MPSIYNSWGFKSSPFITQPLTSDEKGLRLLVGRSEEKEKIQKRISSSSKITTIEGQNGVGKTSLINVSSFEMFKNFLEKDTQELIVPCRKAFQISEDTNAEDFKTKVLIEVAQTLIEISQKYDMLPYIGKKRQVDKWLNSPFISGINAGLQVLNIGVSGGSYSSQNTSNGFSKSGLDRQVEEWLKEVFQNDGGVVCIIDNMEILQETHVAKQKVETLRDVLFTIPGIRWVLSGSNGIVQGILSSPRLDGILYKPIEIDGLRDSYFGQLIESRITENMAEGYSPYLPINMEGMRLLFDTLNKNLRSFFGLVDEYCIYAEENSILPESEEDKYVNVMKWLFQYSRGLYKTIETQLTPRILKVFEDAIAIDGIFSPSDYELFQFTSIEAFRPSVKALEDFGIVTSIKDSQDQRRKTITVTDKGWLISHYLATKEF